MPDHSLVLPRPAIWLRAIRLGGLLALATGLLLLWLWWPDFPQPLNWAARALYAVAIVGALGLLLFSVSRRERPRIAIWAVTAALFVVLIADHLRYWWLGLAATSFSVGLFVALALIDAGIGVVLLAWLWLRHLDQQVPRERDHDLPPLTQFRPLRDGWARSGRSPAVGGPALVSLTVAVLLTAPAVVAHHWPRSGTEVLAAAPSPQPWPTALEGEPAWSRDVDGLMGIAAGANGPIVLTSSGVVALDPADGSTLWRWHRDGANYQQVSAVGIGLVRTVLITSPDGRYVALRLKGPLDALWPELSDVRAVGDSWTVVLDAATGQPVAELLSARQARLQLTNQAVLDGGTAYSLVDGSRLWSAGPPDMMGYTGPAGASSFVAITNSQTMDASVFPEDDPASPVPIGQVAHDPFTGQLAIGDGWAVLHPNADEPEPGFLGSREARAVALDSLLADAAPEGIDLGPIGGVNAMASEASGMLACYPGFPAGTYVDSVRETPQEWVSAVADPATARLLPAAADPGLASAFIGRGGPGQVYLTPRVGSPVTIPLLDEAAPVPEPPQPLGPWTLKQRQAITVLATPGGGVAVMSDGGTSRLVGWR